MVPREINKLSLLLFLLRSENLGHIKLLGRRPNKKGKLEDLKYTKLIERDHVLKYVHVNM